MDLGDEPSGVFFAASLGAERILSAAGSIDKAYYHLCSAGFRYQWNRSRVEKDQRDFTGLVSLTSEVQILSPRPETAGIGHPAVSLRS